MQLETNRLILRTMIREDLSPLHEVFTDPLVMESFGLKAFDLVRMERWLNRNLMHQEQYGYGLFSVLLKETGELIGDCGLEHGDFNGKPCVELGYDLNSRFWNCGYATEAGLGVLEYAEKELGLEKSLVCSFVRRSNKASQRVSEKIGMHRISKFRKYGIDYFLYGFEDGLGQAEAGEKNP